ncbi:hypothetical protein Tco_1411655, partial [Tanacetum coccineum]
MIADMAKTFNNLRRINIKMLIWSRRAKVSREVFVTEDIRVPGMKTNLIPPQGVVGSPELVITKTKAVIFYYNGNFDLFFQREDEFHLATTSQLIRQLKHIKRDTPEAEQMFKKIQFAIKARDDVEEARKIVIDNLDDVIMSSATSAVTYTSVYTDSEPGKAFWGADDEEISEGGPKDPQTPPVPQDEDKREPMFVQAHDPDYMPEPIYPEYIPLKDEHEFPAEEQP